jgi:lipopolysaccharide export LptBFGC system permease protein LptF
MGARPSRLLTLLDVPATYPLPVLTTLDRYVLLKILKTFVPTVLGLCFLFFLAASYSLLRREELSLAQVMLALPWVVPFLIPYLVPMAFMITLALVYGRLVADNEVLAFGSLGIPSRDLGWVSLALGLVLSLGAVWCTSQLLPYCHQKKREALRAVFQQLFELGEGEHWSRSFPKQGFDLYVKSYEPGELNGIVIHYVLRPDDLAETGAGLTTQLVAKRGKVSLDEDGSNLVLILEDVTVTLHVQQMPQYETSGAKPTPSPSESPNAAPSPSAPEIRDALSSEDKSKLSAREPIRLTLERYVQRIGLGGRRRIKPTDRSSPHLLASAKRDQRRINLAAATGGVLTIPQSKRKTALEAEIELGARVVLAMASFWIALLVVPIAFLLRAENPLVPFGVSVLATGGLVFAPLLLGRSVAEAARIPGLVGIGAVVPLGVGVWLNLWASRR